MNIDPLNTRCQIEQPVASLDVTYGSSTVEWELFATRWCNLQDVMPSRGEGVKEGLAVSVKRARWRLRYCTDITSKMRVIFHRPTREIYQIVSPPAILGDKDGIEMMIERVSTDV